MPDTQRAVWRNGGSHSAENDVRTLTAVARRTCSESRRCAKPLVVIRHVGAARTKSGQKNEVAKKTKRIITKKSVTLHFYLK